MITGLNGAGTIRFEGKIKKWTADGHRVETNQTMGVEVEPEAIIALAKYLQFPCCLSDSDHSLSPGHAVWHLQNDHPEPRVRVTERTK